MDFKKLAFRSSLITGAIVLIGGSAILTYDQKPFYQEDLDDTRRMANGIERYIYGQYEYFDAVAKQESKAHPIWHEIDSIENLSAQGTIPYYEAEHKVDSLWNILDSIRIDISNRHADNCPELVEAKARLIKAYNKIDKLTQDSIENDSINSQPWGPRFKKNWNKIFCNQKKR